MEAAWSHAVSECGGEIIFYRYIDLSQIKTGADSEDTPPQHLSPSPAARVLWLRSRSVDGLVFRLGSRSTRRRINFISPEKDNEISCKSAHLNGLDVVRVQSQVLPVALVERRHQRVSAALELPAEAD